MICQRIRTLRETYGMSQAELSLSLRCYTQEELRLICDLIRYFDSIRL